MCCLGMCTCGSQQKKHLFLQSDTITYGDGNALILAFSLSNPFAIKNLAAADAPSDGRLPPCLLTSS